AYIYDVRRETRGPQIFLSRTRNEFLVKLFAQEVPEIYDGIISIISAARDPGSRAKIAVLSKDPSIDPVGACVGMRGSRVQAVVSELQGEKIDIIQWTENMPSFIVNALAPAEVTKLVIDEDSNRVEVVVPDEQQSQAIGRRGQNVRLAAELTGFDIDIMTEHTEAARRQQDVAQRSEIFMNALDVDDVIAQLLVTEGFTTIEEIAFVPVEEMAAIEGFDDDIAEELRNRAQDFLGAEEKRILGLIKELAVEKSLLELPHMTPAMAVAVAQDGAKTLEDFAGYAADELIDPQDGPWTNLTIDAALASQMVMDARIKAGWITQEELDAAKNASAADASQDEDTPGENGA
ncbi:MAG: transcription termination/antitermination protein NusA, partial [Pseudomonadota bacterium]